MTRFRTLERWRSTAFMVAALFLGAFVVRNVILAWGGGFSDSTTAALYVATIVPAELAVYVGLVGLYPQLAARSSRLARIGAAFVGIAGFTILGFAGGVVSGLASSGTPPAYAQVLYLVSLLSTILALFIFGAISLRSGTPSRSTGLLLLVPPTTYTVMLVSMFAGFTPPWSTVLLSAIQATAHLAIGLSLRAAPESTGPAGSATDPTA